MKAKVVVPFGFAFLILGFLIIQSGYFGDDSLNSFIDSAMAEEGRSLAQQYMVNFSAFLPTRVSILQLYHWVFLAFPSLLLFKLFIAGMVLSTLVTLFLLLKEMLGNSEVPLFSVVFVTLIGLQFREYGDSILAFHALTSICLTLMNLSVWLFIRYLRTQRLSQLLSSVVLYTIGCLAYEVLYPFCILYVLISAYVFRRTLVGSLQVLGAYVSPLALLILMNVVARFLVAVPTNVSDPTYYNAYKVGTNLGPIVVTLAKEIVASIPLSNLLMNPYKTFTVANTLWRNGPWFLEITVLLLAVTTVFLIVLSRNATVGEPSNGQRRESSRFILIFSTLLILIPNGIISLSPKYQDEILWGSGYTSIFFGYFGVGLLLSTIISKLFEKRRSFPALVFVSLSLGLLATLNFSANDRVVQTTNTFWKYPRTVAEDALRNGIMSIVPDRKAFVLINSNYPWDVTSFIHKYSKKFLDQEQYTGGEGRFFNTKVAGSFLLERQATDRSSEFSPKARAALTPYISYSDHGNFQFSLVNPSQVYFFDYYSDSDSSGYATLAKVDEVYMSNDSIHGLGAERVRLYVRMPSSRGNYSSTTVSFNILRRDDQIPSGNRTLNENQLAEVSSGFGWKLFEVQAEPQTLIDVKSIRVNTASKTYETSMFPSFSLKPAELKFPLPKETSLLHVGFRFPFNSSYVSYSPVRLGSNYTIAFAVRPGPLTDLPPFSHIVGNHPGKNNFEGFVVQKRGSALNLFDLSIGDGHSWKHVGEFTVSPNKTTVFVASVQGTEATLSIDGKLQKVELGAVIKDSDLPLFVGNYIGKDRPFDGLVRELIISKSAFTEEESERFFETFRD